MRSIRNIHNGPARVYRKGVLVGQFGNRSLFDYNLKDITLNESRNVDSYTAQTTCARALGTCGYTRALNQFIAAKVSEQEVWETEFSEYYLKPDNTYSLSAERKAAANLAWSNAIKETLGDSVVCETETTHRMIAARGLPVVALKGDFASLLKQYGAKSSDGVLNVHELEGRELTAATENVLRTLDRVWQMLLDVDMTMGKDKPAVQCFHQNTLSEGASYGYYRFGDSCVYIRSDISEDVGMQLFTTMIEEVAHYITQSNDMTRDFQEFAFKLAAKLALKS